MGEKTKVNKVAGLTIPALYVFSSRNQLKPRLIAHDKALFPGVGGVR